MRNRRDFTLIYVVGAGHSGSTLLSLLLNGHSRMVGLSELRALDSLLGTSPRGSRRGDPVDASVLATDVWRRVRARYERDTGRAFDQLSVHHPPFKVFRRWDRARIEAWARPVRDLLEAIAVETRSDLLVDASKAWQQLYLLRRSGLVRVKVLHALRDGRAVFHSYDRKYQDVGFSLSHWVKPTLMSAVMRPLFDDADWMTVRYERLASDPAQTLADVCRFLGVEFEPGMLRYRQASWIGIRGNRMSKRDDETIRLDERWRADLSWRKRLLFDLVGGPLNRYFGYRSF